MNELTVKRGGKLTFLADDGVVRHLETRPGVVPVPVLRRVDRRLLIFQRQRQIHRVLQRLVVQPRRGRIVRRRGLTLLAGHDRRPHRVHLVVLGRGGARLFRLVILLAAAEHEEQAHEEGEHHARHYDRDQRGRRDEGRIVDVGGTDWREKRVGMLVIMVG